MDTLDKYLLKEFALYFVIVILGMTSLFLGIDFFSKFSTLDLSFQSLIQLYLYKTPLIVEKFIPVGCLMASLMVLTNMSRANEVLALYAGGVGVVRIASTFIAAVSIVCTFSFLTFDKLSPLFQKKIYAVEHGLDPQDDNALNYKRGRFWYRSNRLIYNVGAYNPQTQVLENINTFLLSNQSQVVQKSHAKHGFYQKEENKWILSDGYVVTYPLDTHYPYSSTFDKKSGVIQEKPEDFEVVESLEETMELRDLREYIERTQAAGFDTTSSKVHYHERLALVFTPLVLVILGIPFATNPLKSHSTAKSIAYCFLLVFIFLLSSKFSISIGKGGHVHPIVAGWGPNIVFTLYAIYLLGRFKKQNV